MFSFHPKCSTAKVVEFLFSYDVLIFYKPDLKSIKALIMRNVRFYFAGVPSSMHLNILDCLNMPRGSLPFRHLAFL